MYLCLGARSWQLIETTGPVSCAVAPTSPTAESHINVIINSDRPGGYAVKAGHAKSNLSWLQWAVGPQTKMLKFALLNVRSIGRDSRQTYYFITQEGLDCLAMTETWLTSDDHSQQQIGDITDLNMAFHHSARSGRRAGCWCFIWVDP